MADVHVFADEAGNFDFSLKPDASRYFVLCTLTVSECRLGDDLLALRRRLAWDGHNHHRAFHATEDAQVVRDEVFRLLASHDFRIDATIFEKRKALPRLQRDHKLYKLAWYQHFKYVAPKIARHDDRLFVAASSVGTKSAQRAFHDAVNDVVAQVTPWTNHCVVAWPASTDPCLLAADYCTWAIQRKWEREDPRSHKLIQDKIRSEFDIWSSGHTYYY